MTTPGNENRRWEIKISSDDIVRFVGLQQQIDGDAAYTVHAGDGGRYWIICQASSEFRMLAKLSMDIEELGMGIDIQL